MPVTTVAVNFIASSLAATLASGGTLGVGDSTTTFATSQTDLQASSNKLRKAFDGGFPAVSGAVISLQATFATSEANFAWNEWGVFTAASGGTMISRKVESLGTKDSSQSWTLSTTITLAAS